MIDLTLHEAQIEKNAAYAHDKGISLPTFKQMRDPSLTPEAVKNSLKDIGLWDIHPLNLHRITWHNEPKEQGGLFDGANYLELPSSLTGVKARIVGLVGKWFPTGAHKVGATYGCLAPTLVTGQFDPAETQAAWPSTGNYCRGGAYVSSLLSCASIAILPEEMSRERFEWLSQVAGEVIATPGSESNVWEIFQKCKELQATRDNITIFDQFEEFGNHLWHYGVTGPAMQEVFEKIANNGDRMAGVALTSGSAGTLGSGDFIKDQYPQAKITVSEALECPTLLYNGFGAHRIEGIGDKHVPWIHNVRNTDLVVGIDDERAISLIRLFNEDVGRNYLIKQGVSEAVVAQLDLLGISGVANMLSAIKMAKYYELTENDVVFVVFTDSMELYGSRIDEMRQERGEYTSENAAVDFHHNLYGTGIDHVLEPNHYEKRRIHNLKYFTWVEQMGKSVEELDAQWHDWPNYWSNIHNQMDRIDELIEAFNAKVG
jgi:cysteine synthase